MKSTKKLEKAVENIDYINTLDRSIDTAQWHAKEALRLIQEFLADNTATSMKGSISCKDFVVKGKEANIRPTMAYIYHDPVEKMAVASDAHVLYACKSEYVETDGLGLRDTYGRKPEHEDELRKYPAWRKVMPDKKTLVDLTVREDLEEVMRNGIAAAKMEGKKKDKVGICVDGYHWMAARMVEIILKAGTDGWRSMGMPDGTPNGGRPMYKAWDGRELLLMPWLADDIDEETKEKGYMFINQ